MEDVMEEIQIQRYPAYKDSGVEWLGEIPEHWEISKLRNIGTFSASGIDKYLKNNEPKVRIINFTDVYGNKSMILDSNFDYMIVTTPESNRIKNLVKKGDLIFLPSSETYEDLGAAALVNEELENTSFSYHVIRLVFQKDIDHDFRKYLTNNNFVLQQFSSQGKGTTRKIIGRGIFKNIQVLLPPLPEQTAIANFLDHKTALIDKAIGIKKKQIELLKERRQILIHKAVTRGLNRNVKMKDSGVEWIGKIPEHWEVKALRFVGKTQNGVSKGSEYFGSGFPFVSYGDVYQGIQLPEKINGLAESTLIDRKQYSVLEGDVLFTRTSETVGEIGFASTCLNTIDDATFAGFLIRFRPNKGVLEKSFSKYYFSSKTHRAFFVKEMNLVIRASLSQELLKKMPILLPPIEEQKSIADYLDNCTFKIATAISLKNKEIEKLKEYKETLINSAVTGKIKVS